MFRVINKDTTLLSLLLILTYFIFCSSVSPVNFQQEMPAGEGCVVIRIEIANTIIVAQRRIWNYAKYL